MRDAECCPALLAEPLDPTDAVELAAVFKALADPVRLQLLSLIAAAGTPGLQLRSGGAGRQELTHRLAPPVGAGRRGLITRRRSAAGSTAIVADRLAQVRAASRAETRRGRAQPGPGPDEGAG